MTMSVKAMHVGVLYSIPDYVIFDHRTQPFESLLACGFPIWILSLDNWEELGSVLGSDSAEYCNLVRASTYPIATE